MRKVILYTAVSLDGFIANDDGGIDWLEDPALTIEGVDYGYGQLMARIDTTLMGHSTYAHMMSFDVPFPYLGLKNYVFTSRERDPYEHVEFVRDDIVDFVTRLRSEEGKDIWLIGGGGINGPLLRAGLIDHMILTKIPVVLGSGIPLFRTKSMIRTFTLENVEHFANGVVHLSYSNDDQTC